MNGQRPIYVMQGPSRVIAGTCVVRQGMGTNPDFLPLTRMDADAVRTAYRRQAAFYDQAFGAVSTVSRRRAVAAVNALPGRDVLEVGVGTGLALPHYAQDKRITGIDLSADMLLHARRRVAARRLTNVQALLELDAENTGLPGGRFDIAVAMFVASVVPHPKRLVAELKRLVRPGGHILLINHFSAERGMRLAVERAMTPLAHTLGWHPDFPIQSLLGASDMARATVRPMPPFRIFSLVHLPRVQHDTNATKEVGSPQPAIAD